MSAVLDFPPLPDIEEPREVAAEVVDAAPASALVTLRDHTMQPLSAVEQGIADLRAEHGSTAYDIKTPAGYRLATLRRAAVRAVRYAVPKIVKAKKAELAGLREQVEEEGERIVQILREIEDPHDALIAAEDKRKEEIKAEAVRVEAARVEIHRTNIDLIRSYLLHAQQPGMTAVRVAAGIEALAAQTYPKEAWEEFEAQALAAQSETLQAMRAVHAGILEREAKEEAARIEAARVEAQRIENERAAAELAALKKKIDDENAALALRAAAFEAEQAEARRVQSERMQAEETARAAQERHIQDQQAAPIVPDEPDAAPAATLEEMGGERVDVQDAIGHAEVDPAPVAASHSIEGVNEWLSGPRVSADFLAYLGIRPASRAGYAEAQLPAIKASLITHLQGLK